jgi:hypothetical protein
MSPDTQEVRAMKPYAITQRVLICLAAATLTAAVIVPVAGSR